MEKTSKNASNMQQFKQNDADFQKSAVFFAENLQLPLPYAKQKLAILLQQNYNIQNLDLHIQQLAMRLRTPLVHIKRMVRVMPEVLLLNPETLEEKIKHIRNTLNIRYDQLLPALAKCPRILYMQDTEITNQYTFLWKTLGFAKLDILEMFRECPAYFLLPSKEIEEKVHLVQTLLDTAKPLYALRLVHTFPGLLLYSKRMIAKRLHAFMSLNINYDYLVYHRSIFTISYYQIYLKIMFAKIFLLDGFFEEVTQLSFQTLYARYRFLQKNFPNALPTLDIIAPEEVFEKKYHISWRTLHVNAPVKPYVYIRIYNRYHFLGKTYGWSVAPILPWRIQLWTNRVLLPKLPQEIKTNPKLTNAEQIRTIFSQLGLYATDVEYIENALGGFESISVERVVDLLDACLLIKQEPSTFASLLLSNPYVLQLTKEEFLDQLNSVIVEHEDITLTECIFNSATYLL